MWELPEATSLNAANELLFTVKHSITVTDFKVKVVSRSGDAASGRWVKISRLNAIPYHRLDEKNPRPCWSHLITSCEADHEMAEQFIRRN